MWRILSTAIVIVGFISSIASAWSNKEHIQLTRLAIEQLIADPATPPAMKNWLNQAAPGLRDAAGEKDYFLHAHVGLFPHGVDGISFYATMPDMFAMLDSKDKSNQKKVEPFDVPERMLHFVDLEQLQPDPARRVYAPDLSNKPRLQDIPHDFKDERFKQAGMLPFRSEYCYQRLVKMIRAGRLVDRPEQYPHDENATKWAGYLAHYTADSTQPQHATIDYKSQSYFPAGHRAPDVHAEMEYRLCDDDKNDYPALRKEYWESFTKALSEINDPIQTNDVWQGALQVSLQSYDALPLIGQAAVASWNKQYPGELNTETFFHYKGQYMNQPMTVMEMKAHQQAWAVKRIEHLLLQAWQQATQAE